MSDYTIKSGATSPDLVATLYDGVQPQDLTGATVRVRMRLTDGDDLVLDEPVVVESPTTSGVVRYTWQATDTDAVGEYEVEWVVTFSNGTEQVFPGSGYSTLTIEPSLDDENPVSPVPALPDNCWPIDEGCGDNFDSYSAEVQARSKAMAAQTMRMLTGYQVGGCPITLRPCKETCWPGYYGGSYGTGVFAPVIYDGTWLNVHCGACGGECSCTVVEQISLPLPVGRVDEVKVDGSVLDPAAYRLDPPGYLVRVDGGKWPTVQDLSKDDTQVGTMSVTYLNAAVVDGLTSYAAGILAGEFAKACTGGKCRLPSGVTEISRRGTTMTIPQGVFTNGLTGIREVDAVILAYNPYQQKMPSTVWSPDQPSHRVMSRGV